MWSEAARFSNSVEQIAALVENVQLRRFYLLSALGQYGASSYFWIDGFRYLGVLHLIVLSGSQVSFFVRPLQYVVSGTCRFFALPAALLRIVIIFFSLFLFGTATAWNPPLSRAILMTMLALVLPRLRWFYNFFICLALQLCLFPSHLGSISFFLSWFSFLSLQGVRMLGLSKFYRCLVLSCICQCFICFFLNKSFSFQLSCLMLISNAVLGYLFETLVMPLVGLLLLFGIFHSCFSLEWPLFAKESMALILNSVARLVLVVLHSLRYIGSHES